jgi:hypothetical protein
MQAPARVLTVPSRQAQVAQLKAELQALVVCRAFIAMPDVGEVPGAFKGPEGAFNQLQNLVVVVHGGHPILGAVAGLSSVVCGFNQARTNHVTMASPHATPNG